MSIRVEFRQMVSAEVAAWFEKNKSKADVLLAVVAKAIEPAVIEQIHRGLLVELGELEPDERERVASTLRYVDAYLVRYAQPPRDQTAELDRVRQSIAFLSESIARRIPATVATGSKPSDAL